MWTAPAGASPVVVAAASAEEQDQHDDQENQHDAIHPVRKNLGLIVPLAGGACCLE
jgi:hypothetical protein